MAALPAEKRVFLYSLFPCLKENEAYHYKALAHQNNYQDSYFGVYFWNLWIGPVLAAFIQGSLRKHLRNRSLMRLLAGHSNTAYLISRILCMNSGPVIQGNLIICYPRSICLLISFSSSQGRNLPVLHRRACAWEIKESKQDALKMSPTCSGGSLNGERNLETDVPSDWIVCVTDSREFSAPGKREAESITAEPRAGCAPRAGTLQAAALLILTWPQH